MKNRLEIGFEMLEFSTFLGGKSYVPFRSFRKGTRFSCRSLGREKAEGVSCTLFQSLSTLMNRRAHASACMQHAAYTYIQELELTSRRHPRLMANAQIDIST